MSSIDKSTQSLKSERYLKQKFSLQWRSPKISIILSILLTIASDRQIGSRGIEIFQDGPFGRLVEAGLYK